MNVPECHDEVCMTCSDEAIAVRVLHLRPEGMAIVSTEQGAEEISVALVDAGPGDEVLVHAKEAIAVLPAAETPRASDDEEGERP